MGFESPVVEISPARETFKVVVKRVNGSVGEASCVMRAHMDHEKLNSLDVIKYAEPFHFETEVYFDDCQVEAEVEIDVPPMNNNWPKGKPIYFALILSDPAPSTAKLTRRNFCTVKIQQTQ